VTFHEYSTANLPKVSFNIRFFGIRTKWHPEKYHQGQLSHRKIATQDNWNLGQWLSRTTATQDNRHPGQLAPRIIGVTHHMHTIKYSLYYCVATHRAVLAARWMETDALRYYCFNIVQQKWAETLLLLLYNSQIKS